MLKLVRYLITSYFLISTGETLLTLNSFVLPLRKGNGLRWRVRSSRFGRRGNCDCLLQNWWRYPYATDEWSFLDVWPVMTYTCATFCLCSYSSCDCCVAWLYSVCTLSFNCSHPSKTVVTSPSTLNRALVRRHSPRLSSIPSRSGSINQPCRERGRTYEYSSIPNDPATVKVYRWQTTLVLQFLAEQIIVQCSLYKLDFLQHCFGFLGETNRSCCSALL